MTTPLKSTPSSVPSLWLPPWPSRPAGCGFAGSSSPAMVASVGSMSTLLTSASVSLPGRVRPGHTTASGTRVPPS